MLALWPAVAMSNVVFNLRPDVLDAIMQLQHFENQFLPNALRKFFKETAPLSVRSDILSDLIAKFSERFCTCNPHLQLSQGMASVQSTLCEILSTPHSTRELEVWGSVSKRIQGQSPGRGLGTIFLELTTLLSIYAKSSATVTMNVNLAYWLVDKKVHFVWLFIDSPILVIGWTQHFQVFELHVFPFGIHILVGLLWCHDVQHLGCRTCSFDQAVIV